MLKRADYLGKIEIALKSNPVVALIGARQVGKTTLMNQLEVMGKKLYLNGQNPEIADVFQSFSTLEKYLQINLDNQFEGTLLIDEFQFIPNVSTMLKLLVDKYSSLKIVVSGSSSIDIHQRISESLAGRVRIIPVFSLSFEEYLYFRDETLYQHFLQYSITDSPAIVDRQIPILLQEYLIFGGLPKVVLTNDYNEKIELLSDIYQTYLLRDVRGYVRNEDFISFNKLLRILASQIGNLVNINELSSSAKLSYNKCEEYLYLLEQMYIIKFISPFTTNKRKEITKMRKVYFFDLGIRNMIYNSFNSMEIRMDNGAIFENFTFLEILRLVKPENLFFYRTKDGSEIDFVVYKPNACQLFEVKYKEFDKPKPQKNITTFSKTETVNAAYLINLNNNQAQGTLQYLPGYYISKIKDLKI